MANVLYNCTNLLKINQIFHNIRTFYNQGQFFKRFCTSYLKRSQYTLTAVTSTLLYRHSKTAKNKCSIRCFPTHSNIYICIFRNISELLLSRALYAPAVAHKLFWLLVHSLPNVPQVGKIYSQSFSIDIF